MKTINEKIVSTLVGKLKEHPANPRRGDDVAIAASIEENGFYGCVVAQKSTGFVLAGNHRLRAAIASGAKKVPVAWVDVDDVAAKRILAADNRTSDLGGYDDHALAVLLDEINDASSLAGTGYRVDDLDEMITGLAKTVEVSSFMRKPPSAKAEVEPTPKPPNKPKTKLGDVWRLGAHRLVCGDSMNRDVASSLMDGEEASLGFFDPPYGYNYESNYQKKHKVIMNDDKILDFFGVAFEAMADPSAIYVCASHQTSHLWRAVFDASDFKYKNTVIWKKNNWSMGDLSGAFACQHEQIIFGHKGRPLIRGKRTSDVWEFDRHQPTDHPTQKPVELVMQAIEKFTDKGDGVLDLFGGSGTTVIACERSGRRAFICELDPKYCDVIVRRWENFTGEKAVRL